MLNHNIETFIGCDAEFDEAKIVLYGAPFDSTTSYRPGARFGPSAIRHESYGIETYSPYQRRDLTDINVFDSSDLELCFGDTAAALAVIGERADEIVSNGKIPLLLGGEHLVTLPPVERLYKQYPDLHVIHFDAHADLRDDYLGARLSHACVLRRIHDLVGDGRIHQFGIRSGERGEFEFAAAHTDMHPLTLGGFGEVRTALDEMTTLLAGRNVPVYVTVDLDVLDPSEFPGTGTPEAGGISFLELLDSLIMIASRLNVVGVDLVELAPSLDSSGRSTALACKLLREVLLAL